MTKNLKPVTLTLSDEQIVLMARAGVQAMFDMVVRGDAPVRAVPTVSAQELPAIGADYHGGIYAGLTLHDNAPAALVLLPGDNDPATWANARSWAEQQGGALPSRIDQLVLFKNLKSEFQEVCYWSGEKVAADGAFAWGQDFYYGDQTYWLKGLKSRARAVRRVPI